MKQFDSSININSKQQRALLFNILDLRMETETFSKLHFRQWTAVSSASYTYESQIKKEKQGRKNMKIYLDS